MVEFINVSGIDDEEVASKTLPLDAGKASTEVTALYAGEGIAAPLSERVLDAKDELAGTSRRRSCPRPCCGKATSTSCRMVALPTCLDMPPADWTKDDFVEYAATTNVARAGAGARGTTSTIPTS